MQESKPSSYAEQVIKRGSECVARELERLQRKIALYHAAMERLDRAGQPLAAETLKEADKI